MAHLIRTLGGLLLLVHAADIHLDSPLRGLSRIGEEKARELRQSTRRALINLVDLIVERHADLLVIAGDLYDGSWHDFGTGQFFIEQMVKLHDEKIPVVIASGNHDAASQITRSLTLPPSVHMLATHEPESVIFDDLNAVVHGQGYATRDVRENLAAGYPHRMPDRINIGVLHTAGAGSSEHMPYAPCSVADLEALRYDYMALGHIHQRGPVADGDFPAYFSGNLQGRNPRETGPKGALLVELEAGSRAKIEFESVDVARWSQVDVDATGMTDYDDLADRVRDRMGDAVANAESRTVILRVNISGTSAIAGRLTDDERLRADMEGLALQSGAVLDKVKVRVRPPAPPDPDAQRIRDAVTEAANTLAADTATVGTTMQTLDRSIRDIARDTDGYRVDLSDPASVRDLLDRARDGLEAKLAERQG